VACRRVADHVRSEAARRNRENIVASLIPPEDQISILHEHTTNRDDTLDLLFLGCHPALTPSSATSLAERNYLPMRAAELCAAAER